MNAGEGLRRIAAVVRWVGIGLAGWGLVVGVAMGVETGLTDDALMAVALGAVAGAAMWALAWITEGFAKGKGD